MLESTNPYRSPAPSAIEGDCDERSQHDASRTVLAFVLWPFVFTINLIVPLILAISSAFGAFVVSALVGGMIAMTAFFVGLCLSFVLPARWFEGAPPPGLPNLEKAT